MSYWLPPDGWQIIHEPTPTLGSCHWPTRTIHVDTTLDRVTRRCVLAHEIIHAERGSFPAWARAREEETVSREAARRLIDLDALTDALAWANDNIHDAAEELGVDPDTLRARLRALTPLEREALTRRFPDGC